jgi:hypothetical protein
MCLLIGSQPVNRAASPLLGNWNVIIRESLNVQVERDGMLVLWSKGRTVFLARRRSPQRGSVRAIRNRLAHQTDATAICVFDYADGPVYRYGYTVRERTPTTEHLGLYAYMIIAGEYLELVFYLEREDDLDWALKIWQEACYGQPEPAPPARPYRAAPRRPAPHLARA